jgi:hypothetical protein
LIKFLANESVFIALLFSGLMLFLSATAPSGLYNVLLVAGLAGVWMAIAMTIVHRL